jgi:hypothetical protein
MADRTEIRSAAERLPWSLRLEQAQQSFGWSDDYCIDLAEDLRDFPLELYLRDDPELLEKLKELWTPDVATFGEAAAVIAHAYMNEEEDEETIYRILRRFVRPLMAA